MNTISPSECLAGFSGNVIRHTIRKTLLLCLTLPTLNCITPAATETVPPGVATIVTQFLDHLATEQQPAAPVPTPVPPSTKKTSATPPNVGVSPYGIFSPHWNCDAMIASYQKLPNIKASVFWNTFGTSTDCYKRLIALPQTKAIEIGAENGSCERSRRCGSYEFKFNPHNLSAARQYYSNIYSQLVAPLRPEQTCYINASVEYNEPASVESVRLGEAYAALKGRCKKVNNPVGSSHPARITGTILEQHGGSLSPSCIFNNDGTSISGSSIPGLLKRYQTCDAAFGWQLCDNGNIPNGAFVDPRARTNFCTQAQFDAEVAQLLTFWGTPPPPAGLESFSDSDRIWKQDTDGGHPCAGTHNLRFGATAILHVGEADGGTLDAYDSAGHLIDKGCFGALFTEHGSNQPIFRFTTAFGHWPKGSVKLQSTRTGQVLILDNANTCHGGQHCSAR